ncbi:MAG: DMT family transporter [Rhodoferax sp.]|jgi:drug/metabolite transporter (DMT)-like permease|nr:DMT family transporter [Rhodoferax sp.]
MPTKLLAAAALVVNAFVWGVSWWPFRLLQVHGLHPLWATAIIHTIALLCLTVLRAGAWRGFGHHPLLWLLVLVAGLTNVGFNWAVTVGDVVRVVLLFYLMPAWVVLLAWPMLGEKPDIGSVMRLVLALGGVVIVLKTPGTPWPVPQSLADGLALMGGFCFALTTILLRKLNQTPDATRMMAMFGGGAVMSIGAALLGMTAGVVQALPSPDVAWVTLVLCLSAAFLLGNFSLQYGAAHLSASVTSLIMLSEVVFASVSSVVLGTAELTTRTLLGGGLIVLASVLSVVSFRKSV